MTWPLQTPTIRFEITDPDAVIPQRQTTEAVGADLHAILRAESGRIMEDGLEIAPWERVLIDTGLKVEIPAGYEIQIRSRSGLSLKSGLIVLNAPGTIDPDYTGKLGVILFNASKEPYLVRHKDRIAQMVVAPYCAFKSAATPRIVPRGNRTGGFGSTGV